MLSKIDVRDIVRDHFATLVDFGAKKTSPGDIILFAIIPAAIAIGMLLGGLLVTQMAASVLLTALAIFAGLLFNLLILTHSLIRSAGDAPRVRDERRLLGEVYSNISYSILVAIFTLAGLLFSYVSTNIYVRMAVSWVTYFLVANFLLTLLMILKRTHVILRKEFKRENEQRLSA